MERGTGAALLRWSRRGEHVCLEGAGGKGWVALWLEVPRRLLLAQLMAGISPPAAPSSTWSPCLLGQPLPGVSTPQQPPSPVPPSPSSPGRRAHSREWGQEPPLTPVHRRNPWRLQALLATCVGELPQASVSPSAKWKEVMFVSLKRFRGKSPSAGMGQEPPTSITGPGAGMPSKARGSQLAESSVGRDGQLGSQFAATYGRRAGSGASDAGARGLHAVPLVPQWTYLSIPRWWCDTCDTGME